MTQLSNKPQKITVKQLAIIFAQAVGLIVLGWLLFTLPFLV